MLRQTKQRALAAAEALLMDKYTLTKTSSCRHASNFWLREKDQITCTTVDLGDSEVDWIFWTGPIVNH